MVKSYPVTPCPFFVGIFIESRRMREVSSYSIFKLELIYNLLLGISNLVMDCIANYFSSGSQRPEEVQKKRKTFVIILP